MAPKEIIEKETSRLKWYVHYGIEQSTASNFLQSFRKGMAKKKTIDKYLKKMGYEKVSDEEWGRRME